MRPAVRTVAVAVPAANPMAAAKAELGQHLFYDARLSGNGTPSCATCHEQQRAFTDGRAQAVGSTGEVHPPYMHDGSIATLDDVLAHYAAGGRTIAGGPYQGIGHDNRNKSPIVRGFALSTGEREDLLAFLRSLTDDAVLRDPRFANPWTSGSPVH